MQVEVSPEAAALVGRDLGSQPALCCGGTPAYLHVATERPAGLSGFRPCRRTACRSGSAPPRAGFPTFWRSA
jgi:hypothetical protein